MKNLLRSLLSEDKGQDLIEYTLLIAFVALASAALFLSTGSNVNEIWSSANSILTTAADGDNRGGRH
jgi:Flp pilus assembly pilin Flp